MKKIAVLGAIAFVATSVGIWGYLNGFLTSPEFVFLSPQIISISPSHEAIVPYSSAYTSYSSLEVKAQVNAKAYATSGYDVTAFLIDKNGVSTQAPHSAITTSGTNGDIVSAIIVDPFFSTNGWGFISEGGLTLKVTWSGKYTLAGFLPRTFQKTALIKFPWIWLTDQTTQGAGSIIVHISGALDFPVNVSLMQSHLLLSTTSFTIPPNATSGNVTANPDPPHCQHVTGSPFCDGGWVQAFASPNDPGALPFANNNICVALQCIP